MPIETFQVSSLSDTDLARVSGTTWPPTGAVQRFPTATPIYPGKTLASGTYTVENLLVRWDTSAIPDDATILSATLRVSMNARSNADSRSVVGDWYVFVGTDIDYSFTDLGGAVPATTILSLPSTGLYDFPLENVSNVSKTGLSGIRLHVTGDAPTGANRAFVNVDTIQNSPTLIVDYALDTTPPAAPTGLAVAKSVA